MTTPSTLAVKLGWESGFRPAGGVDLHVVEAGPLDGPLVVLLHGFPEFWYAWQAQIGALAAAGFRVWVPDQRGYNLSDKPRPVAAYSLDRLSDDLAALIGASGRKQACVAGHDWGGAVAWWSGAKYPERIRRLAIVNCAHPRVHRRFLWDSREQRKKSWYMFFYQLPWLPELWLRRRAWRIAKKALQATSRRGTFDDEVLEHYVAAWSRPGAIRSMVHWYRAIVRCRPARLPSLRLTMPVHLLWGERDRFLGTEMIEPSLALCDRPSQRRFPDATHWILHEEPAATGAELVGFFRAA